MGTPPVAIIDGVSVCKAHIRDRAFYLAYLASARELAGVTLSRADKTALVWCADNNVDLDAEHWINKVGQRTDTKEPSGAAT